MKCFKFYILIIFLSPGIFSCKKEFLDVENTQGIYRQVYVKDLSTLEEFMNGNYVTLTKDLEEGNAAAYAELIADNLKLFSATSSIMATHYTWTQLSNGLDNGLVIGSGSNGKAMDSYWISTYKVIRGCNFVIEEVDKYSKENPGKADNIKGQALAMRAYLYFKLVNTFAQTYKFTPDASHLGVPYITVSDVTKSFSRQTVAEIYNGMIEDLINAGQLLPANPKDTRLMNRSAAKALLARIYLFKEDFEKAKTLATEISNQYPLLSIANGYPSAIFKLRELSQTESLFQLAPYSSGYVTNFLGRYLSVSPIRFVATNDIADILKENPSDARQAWVNFVSGKWNVVKFPTASAPEVTPTPTPAEIAYYPSIIRSSEMFLTVAEASAKLGDEPTARTFLDAIRKRANPSIPSISASGTSLIDSIYKERRKELAFESLRMYDLQRWKLGVHRIDALISSAKDLPYPHNRAIAPIPLRDITVSGLLPNPGY